MNEEIDDALIAEEQPSEAETHIPSPEKPNNKTKISPLLFTLAILIIALSLGYIGFLLNKQAREQEKLKANLTALIQELQYELQQVKANIQRTDNVDELIQDVIRRINDLQFTYKNLQETELAELKSKIDYLTREHIVPAVEQQSKEGDAKIWGIIEEMLNNVAQYPYKIMQKPDEAVSNGTKDASLKGTWEKFKSLVKVQRHDPSDLQAGAGYNESLHREKLLLTLEHIRLAGLHGQDLIYKQSIVSAKQLLIQYFDTENELVKQDLAKLNELEQARD